MSRPLEVPVPRSAGHLPLGARTEGQGRRRCRVHVRLGGNACWTAALAARATSGTGIPGGTASIMLFVISLVPAGRSWRAIAAVWATDAGGGAMAMT